MQTENYASIIQIVAKQETLLRFDAFTAETAWDLGSFIVSRVRARGIDMAVSIRKLNGHILFQYCTPGTSLNNQNWMNRKANTVALTEGASLRAWASMNVKGQTFADMGLDALSYAFCGGGFPIRLKTGELAGMVIVSNLPHMDDHRFLVDCLAAFLNVDNLPML